jgi:molecular chaperone DnaK (HSP70)
MSDNAGAKGPEPGDRVAIGITFGNSNSSIAYTVDDKAEVIANEDGGTFAKKRKKQNLLGTILCITSVVNFANICTFDRPTNSYSSLLR